MAHRPLTSRRNSPMRRILTMKQTTIREFDGGWNVIDNDLNLSSKYAKVLRNVYRAPDGSVKLRYGTKLFTTFSFLDEIINVEYYANAINAVDNNGNIGATDGLGTVIPIWNDEIAGNLPGSPAGWSETDFVSFTKFRGDLILGNGIDKPLIIDPQLRCQYLYDLGSGTNINTPVGRYVTSNDRYVVIGGDPVNPSLLHISNTDTSGTWVGDPTPNDAITFDMGPYVSIGSSAIKGVGSFRDKLIISFEEVIAVVQLGVYDDSVSPAVHTPQVEDVIPQYGSISHRAIQSLGDDMLFCDIVGVPSIKRSLYTEQIKPDRVSQLIDPAIQSRLVGLSTRALEDRVFSVYDRNEGQYMLFIPNEKDDQDISETVCFAYTKIPALKVNAWSEFRGWNWRCACRSAQGRIFFGRENKLFILGSREDELYGDFIEEQETFSDGTVFTDGTGITVPDGYTAQQLADTGVPVAFDWQLPWADFDNRGNIKNMRYLGIDAKGDAQFTAELFVDNIIEDNSSLGESFSDGTFFTDDYGFSNEDPLYLPTLSLDFVGGDARGFGVQPFGRDHFGGGRRSADERLYAYTTSGKIFKFRVHGETRRPLRIVSLTFHYQTGNIQR